MGESSVIHEPTCKQEKSLFKPRRCKYGVYVRRAGRNAGFRMFQKLTEKDNKGGVDTWKMAGGVGTRRSGGWDPPNQSLHGAVSPAEMRTCREAGRAHGEGRSCWPPARRPGSAGAASPTCHWLEVAQRLLQPGRCGTPRAGDVAPALRAAPGRALRFLRKSPAELDAPDASCGGEAVLLSK